MSTAQSVPGQDYHFCLRQLYVHTYFSAEAQIEGKCSVYIRPDSANGQTSDIPWWIAKIEEIRAQDERNVFMWVYGELTV